MPLLPERRVGVGEVEEVGKEVRGGVGGGNEEKEGGEEMEERKAEELGERGGRGGGGRQKNAGGGFGGGAPPVVFSFLWSLEASDMRVLPVEVELPGVEHLWS